MWVRDEVNDVIYVILMNLVVPHFFMMDVDCGDQALPIIAISTLNLLIYHIHDMCSFCILLFAPPSHATHRHLYPYQLIL